MAPPGLVIFDMDGVLVRYDPDQRRAAMGALAGLDAADVFHRIWESGIEDAADAGVLDADGYLLAVEAALGVPFDRDRWLRTRRIAMTLDPSAVALAQTVGTRARIALLTNNGLLMREHFDMLVPELRSLFGSAMHVAAEFGTKKPDPEVYRRLLALHGVEPVRALMIDDQARHIEGARAAGLQGHHFNGVPGLAACFRTLGLL